MFENIDAVPPVGMREEPAQVVPRWNYFKFDLIEPVKAWVRMAVKAREVQEIVVRPEIAGARVVVVLVVKDEAPRLPFLLEYYRRVGVEHFLVIDNRSTDDVRSLLADEPDVSLFAAEGDYAKARFGDDWVNWLLRQYCVGKWVLWIDADEFLVFSNATRADIHDLVKELERREQLSLQTLMLDMYSARPANSNVVAPGTDPLDVCDLYDASGYVRRLSPETGTTWVKGGVRGRLFFRDVWAGPALNKTPLVKWQKRNAFLKSTHELWPRRLNGNGQVQGVLLHFKFTATSVEKMGDSDVRQQHTSEYDAYSEVERTSFVDSVTQRFVGVPKLVEHKLFEPVV